MSRQNALISPAARRSRSEKEIWFETISTPCFTRTRRWAVSKFVTPRWRISPSRGARRAPSSRRDRPRCSKLHQWNCRRSIVATPRRRSCARRRRAPTSAVIGPGAGTIGEGDGPMRAGSFARGDASQKPSRDQFRAAVVVGHVEGVEARSGVSSMAVEAASGSSGSPSRSMSATCQRPVTMRLMSSPAQARCDQARRPSPAFRSSSGRGGCNCSAIFAFSALTSSVRHLPDRRHLAVGDLPERGTAR